MKIWQRIFRTSENEQTTPEDRTAPEQANSHCFVCEAKLQRSFEEKPYQWLEPRVACWRHHDAAVLESGELVSTFLERRKSHDYPLEGSGLNYVINPVTVDGIKGWINFIAGTWFVIEEIFPSRDYFEFHAQHSTTALDGFYAIYENRALYGNRAYLKKVLNTERKQDGFYTLCNAWATMREISDLLRARGKSSVESPDEAEEVWSELTPNRGYSGYSPEFLACLMELGKNRFAHLPSET